MVRFFILLCTALFISSCGGGAGDPPPVLVTPAWVNSGVKIMPLGDSITEGYVSANGGYRYELYKQFIDLGLAVNFVGGLNNTSAGLPDPDHEGHGGWTSTELLSGRSSDPGAGNINTWLSQQEPQIVLLMIGTNDVFRTSDAGLVSQNILALVDHIRAQRSNVELFVGSIPPVNFGEGMEQNIANVNALVFSGLSARMVNDSRLHFVDTNTVLNTADIANDKVHIDPNGSGNRKLADAWMQAIQGGGRQMSP